jgi:hypothetical protein
LEFRQHGRPSYKALTPANKKIIVTMEGEFSDKNQGGQKQPALTGPCREQLPPVRVETTPGNSRWI